MLTVQAKYAESRNLGERIYSPVHFAQPGHISPLTSDQLSHCLQYSIIVRLVGDFLNQFQIPYGSLLV